MLPNFDSQMYRDIMENAPNFFVAVRNPKWADAGKTKIECEVNFKHVHFEEWTPFCADPADYMPYSKDIFDRAVAGEFGEVAEPQLVEVVDTLSPERLAAIKAQRDQLLAQQANQIPGAIL